MAMDFKAAAGKVRSLLAPKRPKDLSRSALTPDPLRDNIIAEAEARSERFRKSINKQPELSYEDEDGNAQTYKWEGFPDAMRDTARANFGFDEPEIAGRADIMPSRRLNREVAQALISSDDFEKSRPYTRNSEVESLYGAMAAADSLRESAEGFLADHVKRSNEISEAEQDAQTAEEMFEKLRQQARREIKDLGAVQDPTRRSIKQTIKQQGQAQTNLSNLMQQQASSSMVVDAIAAGQAAAAAQDEAIDLISGLPGVEPGTAHVLNADQQIALAEKWAANPDLKAIIKMVGRMLRSFRFRRNARTKNVAIEPVGITTGNDLGRLLPHELARGFSSNRLIKTTFMRDYVQRQLLQYDMEGKAPAGKGPIIATWDGSGSMAGEPFVWASSVALTLLTTALKEFRAFAGIEFGSKGQLAWWYFPAREPADPDKVLEMTGHFFNGGTDITTGFEKALEIVESEPAFKSADIVLIGDGEDHFQDDDLQIRNRLRELGVRIHGITIMAPGCLYFKQMCDYSVDVQELAADASALGQLAENIT